MRRAASAYASRASSACALIAGPRCAARRGDTVRGRRLARARGSSRGRAPRRRTMWCACSSCRACVQRSTLSRLLPTRTRIETTVEETRSRSTPATCDAGRAASLLALGRPCGDAAAANWQAELHQCRRPCVLIAPHRAQPRAALRSRDCSRRPC
eukprot:scaffold533_cov369-Prasinococcus_capsulatus_cf.AAC.13